MELLRRIEQEIRRAGLLRAGQRVGVACSGGADSVALLLLLDESKDRLGLRLLVAHLNHQLRGTESDADESFVRSLAERRGLEFVGRREDIAARARKMRLNLEAAGREARLEFFATLLAERKAEVVATAHTMDDQAETVLARLLRGAGTRGLAGIYPVVELGAGRLVRPLLGVRRSELRDYMSEREQPWREDTSNLDRRRLRNRIRLELLPQLGLAVVESLARLAEQAREEEDLWAALSEESYRTLVRRQNDDCELEVNALLAPGRAVGGLPERVRNAAARALARRLIRRVVAAVRGDLRRLTQAHVESVVRLAEEGQSGQRVMLPGVEVERVFERLVFRGAKSGPHEKQQETAGAFAVSLDGPGSVPLPDGGLLRLKFVAVGQGESGYNEWKRAADADRMTFPLMLRTWQPGDRFQPVGATRGRKLKELFHQARVPAGQRRRTPVLLRGDEIVWVAGLGPAAGYELMPGSRRALVIEAKVGT